MQKNTDIKTSIIADTYTRTRTLKEAGTNRYLLYIRIANAKKNTDIKTSDTHTYIQIDKYTLASLETVSEMSLAKSIFKNEWRMNSDPAAASTSSLQQDSHS